MKLSLLLIPLALSAQQPTPVNLAALPGVVAGIGTTYARGTPSKWNADLDVAFHIGQGCWYSWSKISTPIETGHITGPVLSALSTGGACVLGQSNRFSLITIMQAGFSGVVGNSTSQATISGSLGALWRLTKNLHLMVDAIAENPSAAANALVMQPEAHLVWGFAK